MGAIWDTRQRDRAGIISHRRGKLPFVAGISGRSGETDGEIRAGQTARPPWRTGRFGGLSLLKLRGLHQRRDYNHRWGNDLESSDIRLGTTLAGSGGVAVVSKIQRLN